MTGYTLKQVRVCPMQHTGKPSAEARGMSPEITASPPGFHADQVHVFVMEELVKDAHSIGATAHAGNDRIRQPALSFQDLLARFTANAAMKVAHHGWIGMRPQHAPEEIVRSADVGDPVAHRFVDRIL